MAVVVARGRSRKMPVIRRQAGRAAAAGSVRRRPAAAARLVAGHAATRAGRRPPGAGRSGLVAEPGARGPGRGGRGTGRICPGRQVVRRCRDRGADAAAPRPRARGSLVGRVRVSRLPGTAAGPPPRPAGPPGSGPPAAGPPARQQPRLARVAAGRLVGPPRSARRCCRRRRPVSRGERSRCDRLAGPGIAGPVAATGRRIALRGTAP